MRKIVFLRDWILLIPLIIGTVDVNPSLSFAVISLAEVIYTVSQKNWATFIFTVTLSNVGRF